jgi:hypothetical protein
MTTYDKIRFILNTFSKDDILEINESIFNLVKTQLLEKHNTQWMFNFLATKDKVVYKLEANTSLDGDVISYGFNITVGKMERIMFTAFENGETDSGYLDDRIIDKYINVVYRKTKINNILN